MVIWHDSSSWTLAPNIGHSSDENNHLVKKRSRDLTILNHQNNREYKFVYLLAKLT